MKDILEEYAGFLLKNAEVRERYIPFYQGWVRKCLKYLDGEAGRNNQTCLRSYIEAFLRDSPS